MLIDEADLTSWRMGCDVTGKEVERSGRGRGKERGRGEERLTPKMYGGLMAAKEKVGFSSAMNLCAALSASVFEADGRRSTPKLSVAVTLMRRKLEEKSSQLTKVHVDPGSLVSFLLALLGRVRVPVVVGTSERSSLILVLDSGNGGRADDSEGRRCE